MTAIRSDSAARPANRRRHPRIAWPRPARLTAACGAVVDAQVRDLSFDGLGLLVGSRIADDRCEVRLRLPRLDDGCADREVVLHCRLLYSAPTRDDALCRVGLAIEAVEKEADLSALRQFLAFQLEHRPETICPEPPAEADFPGCHLNPRADEPDHDRLAKLLAQVPGVLFQYRVCANGHACFPFANQAMQDIYELTPDEVRQDASLVSRYHHPDDAAGILASLKESARSLRPWHYEYRVVLPRQGLRWRLGNARPEKLADGSILWHGFITDITERKRLEQELERQAHLDHLTGLANRRHFMALAERELSRAGRYGTALSVLMLDVDHFKFINDSFGHQVGDRVLQGLGDICRGMLRDVDIVGRLGGEEFAILLPMTDAREARDTAERLRHTIAAVQIRPGNGLALRMTVSIGIASRDAHAADIDSLLARADEALYRAKRAGRNQVFPPAV